MNRKILKMLEINRKKKAQLYQVELSKFMKLRSVDQRPSFLHPLTQLWNV